MEQVPRSFRAGFVTLNRYQDRSEEGFVTWNRHLDRSGDKICDVELVPGAVAGPRDVEWQGQGVAGARDVDVAGPGPFQGHVW